MSQLIISNGQTPLLAGDIIQLAKDADHDLYVSGVDFYLPFKSVLPTYAKTYGGSYYEVPKNTGNPTAFSAAIESLTSGAIFEEAIPTDCIDDGITSLDLYYTDFTGNVALSAANVVHNEDETAWEKSLSNTGAAYWRMAGRKIRVFFPSPGSSGSPKYTQSYKRYPTIPTSSSDGVDAPADDISSLIEAYKAAVHTP